MASVQPQGPLRRIRRLAKSKHARRCRVPGAPLGNVCGAAFSTGSAGRSRIARFGSSSRQAAVHSAGRRGCLLRNTRLGRTSTATLLPTLKTRSHLCWLRRRGIRQARRAYVSQTKSKHLSNVVAALCAARAASPIASSPARGRAALASGSSGSISRGRWTSGERSPVRSSAWRRSRGIAQSEGACITSTGPRRISGQQADRRQLLDYTAEDRDDHTLNAQVAETGRDGECTLVEELFPGKDVKYYESVRRQIVVDIPGYAAGPVLCNLRKDAVNTIVAREAATLVGKLTDWNGDPECDGGAGFFYDDVTGAHGRSAKAAPDGTFTIDRIMPDAPFLWQDAKLTLKAGEVRRGAVAKSESWPRSGALSLTRTGRLLKAFAMSRFSPVGLTAGFGSFTRVGDALATSTFTLARCGYRPGPRDFCRIMGRRSN